MLTRLTLSITVRATETTHFPLPCRRARCHRALPEFFPQFNVSPQYIPTQMTISGATEIPSCRLGLSGRTLQHRRTAMVTLPPPQPRHQSSRHFSLTFSVADHSPALVTYRPQHRTPLHQRARPETKMRGKSMHSWSNSLMGKLNGNAFGESVIPGKSLTSADTQPSAIL